MISERDCWRISGDLRRSQAIILKMLLRFLTDADRHRKLPYETLYGVRNRAQTRQIIELTVKRNPVNLGEDLASRAMFTGSVLLSSLDTQQTING